MLTPSYGEYWISAEWISYHIQGVWVKGVEGMREVQNSPIPRQN